MAQEHPQAGSNAHQYPVGYSPTSDGHERAKQRAALATEISGLRRLSLRGEGFFTAVLHRRAMLWQTSPPALIDCRGGGSL